MTHLITPVEDPRKNVEALERGDILFYSEIPFSFPPEEISFLLEQKQTGNKGRKNIAYKPATGQLTNVAKGTDGARLKEVLKGYSDHVASFLTKILAPYAPHWKIDYASFRPFEEKGRPLRLRARNDLLHVDAFPTRPMHGDRILRFFTNIHPTMPRQWVTGTSFEEVVQTMALPFPPSPRHTLSARFVRYCKKLLAKQGFSFRSPYDTYMLRLHHAMKENSAYQSSVPKKSWHFPPGSCWIVFTDQVSHAALAGQYALEQTFVVPTRALIRPELSPLSVLERLSNRNLLDRLVVEKEKAHT